MKPKVGIISAGALGTALAQSISKNNDNILLWGRNLELINEINKEHTNSKYYPNFQLNENITGIDDLEKLHEQHKAAGLEITDLKGLPGTTPSYYFVIDPDGYKIEVIRG